jgi:hypothetical protein
MASQGELFNPNSQPPRPPQAAPPRAHGPQADPEPAPIWLQRLSLIVLVLFCFYIGGLLAVLPWSPRYFDSNGWLLAHPAIGSIVSHSWMRGILSGIGLLDVWIGISELMHYRDYRA